MRERCWPARCILFVFCISILTACEEGRPDKKTLCTDPGADSLARYYSCGFDSVRKTHGVPVAPASLKVYRMGYDFIAWGDIKRQPSAGVYYMLTMFNRPDHKHVRDFGKIYLNDSLDMEFSFGNGRMDRLPADHFESWIRYITTGATVDLSKKEFDSILHGLR